MKLYAIETGRFRLDGGAMFGVVPKTIWGKTNPADADNRIDMAMRCLLIEEGNRLVLIDNGLGHKYNKRFAELYAIDHSITLDISLAKYGFSRSDVTDLVLTHLHFDHCGGTTELDPATERARVAFDNAKIYVQRKHLDWALAPNDREKASFFAENIDPIRASGQLTLLDGDTELLPGLRLQVFNGHTEGQQLPVVQYNGRTLLFAADLFPTYGHIPLPYVMAYDVRPLLTLDERARILPWLVDENVILFYEHDAQHECGTVVADDKGRYKSEDTFPLSALG